MMTDQDQSEKLESVEVMTENQGEKLESAEVMSVNRREKLESAEVMTKKAEAFLETMDFSKAVACFRDALEIRIEIYGKDAVECTDAYLQYGAALLKKVQSMEETFFAKLKIEADERIEIGEPAESEPPSNDNDEYVRDLGKSLEILSIAKNITCQDSFDSDNVKFTYM